ncbi:MAG: transporter [Gemmatimonadota bacterium]|nr:MAG: transporter [Gemmatimonadota bacterium]
MIRISVFLVALLLSGAPPTLAQWTSSRADGHAPLGVMGDHTHHAGEIMLSYRYMYIVMEDSRVGTAKISNWNVVNPDGDYQYSVTPTSMPMQVHMFGVMYSPTDFATLTLTIPVHQNLMDHMARDARTFTTVSRGLGDIKLGGLIRLPKWDRQSLHLNLAVGIPTGSIDKQDVTPASAPLPTQLPYPMQTGSGTWDVTTGLTYLGQITDLSWGIQGLGTFRLGTNSRGYALGSTYHGTGWLAYRFVPEVSASLRGVLTRQHNIDGADPDLDPAFVPTADPLLRAFTRAEVGMGLNTYVTSGFFEGLRLAVEGLIPFYQDLDGPQLELDWTIVAGGQYSTHF